MRISGYQPQYFPRLHYFARILDSDIFEISDHFQFVKAHKYPNGERGPSYQADTVVKLGNGPLVLPISVRHDGSNRTQINETGIAYESRWHEKHKKNFTAAFDRSLRALELLPGLDKLLGRRYKTLAELNIVTIAFALAFVLGEERNATEITVADLNRLLSRADHPFRLRKIAVISETGFPARRDDEDATDWLINMCHYFKVTEYYHGATGAQAYMDFDRFHKADIKTIEQKWNCMQYSQRFLKIGFIRNLSILDLIANEPKEKIWSILQGEK
ncbi:MAG: WbqC family protein [bacterium]|nr:WbqC family protein [bacterium]